MGFIMLRVDANAQSIVKEPEQKILHQCGWLSIISSDQGSHFIAHNVRQGAERFPPQSSSLDRTRMGNLNVGGQTRRREKHEGLAYTPSRVCSHST